MCTTNLAIFLFAFGASEPVQGSSESTSTENKQSARPEVVVSDDKGSHAAMVWAETVGVKDDYATVEVFIKNYVDLRGYEVAVELFGLNEESATLVDAFIDTEKADYVFRDVQPFNAIDLRGSGRLAGALMEGGVDGDAAAYLGTFVYQIPKEAGNHLRAKMAANDRTQLRGSSAQPIEFKLDDSKAANVESQLSATVYPSTDPRVPVVPVGRK